MSGSQLDVSSVSTWHYAVSATERAQTTANGAKALFKAGTVKPETLVWCTGMSEWTPVNKVPGLLQHLSAVPTPAVTSNSTSSSTSTSTSSSPSDSSSDSGWHYLDTSQTQCGPITLAQLSDKISKGDITTETYGWRNGLADWAPLSTVPELVPVFNNQWFYVDKQKQRAGPVQWSAIVDAYRRFELNDTTQAWRQGLSDWKPLSEISDFQGMLGVVLDDKGNVVNSGNEKKDNKHAQDEEAKKRKRDRQKAKKKAGKWVSTEDHANVYVQGLPEDTTIEEAHEFFKKAGLIKEDPKTQWKIKLYEDSTGKKKGDALISYKLQPSVDLAIQLLDQSHFRPGNVISVQKAQFKMKGEKYVPHEKPKTEDKKPTKKAKHGDKDLSWDEGEYDDVATGGLRIVILKHMFDPSEAEGDDNFYDELKAEIGMEVEKKAGAIEKLTIFNGNKEGAVAIKFKLPSSAEACIKLMNGRYFGKRAIECNYFDGKTNYKVVESEASQQKRQEDFGKWLEGDSSSTST